MGFDEAYWILIVMPCVPYYLYVTIWIFCKYFTKATLEQQQQQTQQNQSQSRNNLQGSVELSLTSNPLIVLVELNQRCSMLDKDTDPRLILQIIPIFEKKFSGANFDKFLDKIVKSSPLDLKVVEIIDVDDEDVDCEEISAEDTLSILDKYVEEAEFGLDKTIIKKLLRDVYKEALETN
jgi:hypothetical protein